MKTRRVISIFLCAAFIAVCLGPPVVSAEGTVTLTADLSNLGKTVTNKSCNVNVWDLNGSWLNAGSQPADYYATHDPYVKTVDLMTATGGSASRDLFVDPNNRSNLTDYKFDNLIEACANILGQGLKPKITTGNVPLKYSANPVMSGPFAVNVKPPDDYGVYYNYIKAIADALKDRFGLGEVKTWIWGVLTEYENRDWFDAGDADSTKIAYFKLYDYTVAALEDSLGADNVYVGAHSMTCAEGYWDEKEFLNHCKNGTNYKRGATGTQLDYVSISYYDNNPVGFISAKFISCINELRDYANAIGLEGLKYGVDEGRLIAGWDNWDLLTRDVAHCSQGAADAKMFKVMVDNDVDWFAQWDGGQSTEWFGGARNVAGHIRNLVYKMTGDRVAGTSKTGKPAKGGSYIDGGDEVDGLVSYDSATHTVHVLAYNSNIEKNAAAAETTTVKLNNIVPVSGNTATVKKWIVDEAHANWWSTWWQDQAKRGLSSYAYFWSRFSSQLPANLLQQADKDYWNSRLSVYQSLGKLSYTTQELPIKGNTLTLVNNTAHHGVVFYEITNLRSTK